MAVRARSSLKARLGMDSFDVQCGTLDFKPSRSPLTSGPRTGRRFRTNDRSRNNEGAARPLSQTAPVPPVRSSARHF